MSNANTIATIPSASPAPSFDAKRKPNAPIHLRKLAQQPWVRALLALVLIAAIGMIFNPGGIFYKWSTHRDMLRQVSVAGMLACGMTLVIITGGIDLAVGSVVGFTAVLFSLLTLHLGWPAALALPVCVLTGAACGALSGGLIAGFNIQPFIATLAMMVFARGLAKSISGGQKISTAVLQADDSYKNIELPALFGTIDHRILGENIAVVTLVMLVCVLACYVLLTKLRWGRYFYATGGNENAARLSGVPTKAIKVWAYGLSGVFSAIAGICQAAQEQQGDPEAGAGYELTAIAMVVIGGTSLAGGRGGIALTLIGAFTIGYLEKILSINAVGESSRLMLTGLIIVAAVLLQRSKK
ncbi:MAG: ABC transporter permease [Deltaproteobacteria bacterium]|nr:ABC transporter permease [Deltaproteobacteria bacterium]